MTEAPPPFVVFALPRSRTFWTSRYLSYMGWHCGHDEIIRCRSQDDVKSWLAMPFTGTAETAAAPFWRLLKHYRPDARIAVIRRPVEEVVASFAAKGWRDTPELRRLLMQHDRKLDRIAQQPGVFRATFAELQQEQVCAALFEHCLPGMRHDHAWWQLCQAHNLQIDLGAQMRYMAAHAPQLEKMRQTAKRRVIQLMRPEPGPEDGVTFHVERFEAHLEAKSLFAEHLIETDQAPDAWEQKNLPLLKALYDMGKLQIMTARSNGRMFGYLMTVIAPSLDSAAVTEGQHTIFFASPSVRNLGMRLQRAALDALRERGVNHVYMRTGNRGVGPRLGAFYRRLGAEEFGHLYRMDLGEA